MNALVLVLSLTSLVASPSTSPRAGFNLFVDDGCGFSFEYPQSWIASKIEDATYKLGYSGSSSPGGCAVGIEPPDWQYLRAITKWPLDKVPITINVVHAGMRDVATGAHFWRVGDFEEGFFPPHVGGPDAWLIDAGRGFLPAKWLKTSCCRGLSGEQEWGSSPEEREWATNKLTVLNNYHGRSAIIRVADTYYDGVGAAVVESFQFHEPAPD